VPALAAGVEASALRTFTVEPDKTFDKKGFDYEIREIEKKGRFTIHEVRFPSSNKTEFEENNVVPGYYYLPDDMDKGPAQRPAVICLHILEGSGTIARLVCSMLAEAGVPSMWFNLAYFGSRRPQDWKKKIDKRPDAARVVVEGLFQSAADTRRALDLLASRPEVDGSKIGLVGVSFGGIVSATTAGMDERFKRVVMVLAGGDLVNIIGVSWETDLIAELIDKLPPEEKKKVIARIGEFDPLRHASKLARRAGDGRILMFNAAEDRVIPPECSRKLAAAMGMEKKVVWKEGLGHYTMIGAISEILEKSTEFFAADLPPDYRESRRPKAAVRLKTAFGMFLHDLSRLLAKQPDQGRCFFADLVIDAKAGGEKIEGSVKFMRDGKNRFRLTVDSNTEYSGAAGSGQYPWLYSPARKTLFCGDKDIESARPLVDHIDPECAARVRGIAGLCGLASVFPGVFEQWVNIETSRSPEGDIVVTVRMKEENKKESLKMLFDGKSLKPVSLEAEAKDLRARVRFRHWDMEAVANDGMFSRPDSGRAVHVQCGDLNRMFAAVLNMLVEKVR
jgi:dienelactone hydrolase